jgi:hypothetical protein
MFFGNKCVEILSDYNFFLWIMIKVPNYKVVTLLKTFPMISSNPYKNEHEMVFWLQKKLELMFP